MTAHPVPDDDPRLSVVHRPRECFRSDGIRKRTLTRRQAKALAKEKGSGLVAYRCGECDNWHLASKPTPRSIP